MQLFTLTLLALTTYTLATPSPAPTGEALDKRQQNIPQLLELASLAGITALPTDPAVLLQLGPVASQLAAALPTSPVLSVLETAAPKSFLSNIVHDPTYASSFESAFAAGSSPSWFNALPTDVRSYLHTYTGFGGLATAAAELNSVTSNSSALAGATEASGSASQTEMSMTGRTMSASSTMMSMMTEMQTTPPPAGSAGAVPAPSSRVSTGVAAQLQEMLLRAQWL